MPGNERLPIEESPGEAARENAIRESLGRFVREMARRRAKMVVDEFLKDRLRPREELEAAIVRILT